MPTPPQQHRLTRTPPTASPMIKPLLLLSFLGRGSSPSSSSRRDFLRGRDGASASAGATTSTASTISGSGSGAAGALMIIGLEHFGHFTVLPMAVSGALIFAEHDGQMRVSGI